MSAIRPGDLVRYTRGDQNTLQGGPGRVVAITETTADVITTKPAVVLDQPVAAGERYTFALTSLEVVEPAPGPLDQVPALGTRFRTIRAFCGVPAGTTCTVVEHYSSDHAGVMVEWDRDQDVKRRKGQPPVLEPRPASDLTVGLRDGFTLGEIHDFLVPEAAA